MMTATTTAANASTYNLDLVVGRRMINNGAYGYFNGYIVEVITAEGYLKGQFRLGDFDGEEHILPASILGSRPWAAMPETCTPDEVAYILAVIEAKKSAAKRAQAAQEAADAAECARLVEAHPDLVTGRYRDTAVVNMRTLLKQAFASSHKGVRFSVTQPRGSGVDGVNIKWTGGPSEAEVSEVVARFQSSSWSDETGTVSCRTPWNNTFGGCGAIHYTRTRS